MSTPELEVRTATRADVPRIAATLAAAWADYRWSSWAFPDDGRAQRLHRWHELTAGWTGVDAGTTWVDGTISTVAAWTAPDAPGPAADLQAVLDRDLAKVFGSRHRVVLATEQLAALGLPEEPHWRLTAVGTRPGARDIGLAGQVCAPVLTRCDAEGVPAALTAYTSQAVRWAQRLGFAVTHATRSAVDHELPVWTMVRRPARP